MKIYSTEIIDKEPAEYGYEFGRWTSARLATYLEKLTGIKLSGSQVRRILSRKKYVYRALSEKMAEAFCERCRT